MSLDQKRHIWRLWITAVITLALVLLMCWVMDYDMGMRLAVWYLVALAVVAFARGVYRLVERWF